MSTLTTPPRPLEGIRILDLSTNLPGPFASQIFADLGAEVIMVEAPSGEPSRSKPNGLFYAGHRNKSSIVLNLKDEADRETALSLVKKCDVVMESFRPGVVDRLGVGFDAVVAQQPRIVYLSISGYGQTSSRRDDPGHDINYLAAAGGLSFSGHWDKAPARSGIAFGDLGTSLYSAIAILAALRNGERTGEPAFIDLSMTDVAIALTATRGGMRLEQTNDSQEHMWPTNDLFVSADGKALTIGAIEEHLWQNLRATLAQFEPRFTDPRFDTEPSRRENGTELVELLRTTFAQKSRAEWVEIMAETDTAISPVLTIAEAVDSDHARSREGLVQEKDGVRQVMLPFLWNGIQPGVLQSVGPEQGEHQEEILRWLSS